MKFKKSVNDSKPVICSIEKMQDILNDIDSFKRYVQNNKRQVSPACTEGELYAIDIVMYCNYLSLHGYRFNNTMKMIARKCESIALNIDYKYKLCKATRPEDAKKNRIIKKIVTDLVKDEKKLKDFFFDNKKYRGITYEDICKYVLDQSSVCSFLFENEILVKNQDVVRNMHRLYLYCSERQYDVNNRPDEPFEINAELKAKVLGGVSQKLLNKEKRTNEEQVELAYQVFCSLNKVLSYDEKMHIDNQHLLENNNMSECEIFKTYYRNPSDVTLDDNGVACRAWSFLYAKILNEINIRAFVCLPYIHKKVLFLDNDAQIYCADGTQIQNSASFGLFKFTDMERSKLGLRCTNFVKISLNKLNYPVCEIYKDGKFGKMKLKMSYLKGRFEGNKARIKLSFSRNEYALCKDFFKRALNNEPIGDDEYENVKKILKAIEESEELPEIFLNPCGENGLSRNKSFVAKLKLLNRMLLTLEPHLANDNTVTRAMVSNFRHLLLADEYVSSLNRLYVLDEKGKVKIRPVLYLEGEERSEDDGKYPVELMYIWDNKRGFVRTTPDQIKQKLKNGELYYNYYTDDNYRIKSDIENDIESDLEKGIEYSAFHEQEYKKSVMDETFSFIAPECFDNIVLEKL